MNCKNCGQPLIAIKFQNGSIYVCDNWQCHFYRERQGSDIKEPEEPTQPKPAYPGSVKYLSTRETYDAKRRENYRLLRNLGIPSREAANMTSNKQTRFALAWKTGGTNLL